MNLLRRPPARPYRNLWLAVLLGVPLAALFVAIGLALRAPTATRALALLGEALPTVLFGYLLAWPIALVFGVPALWLALRVRLAGPAVALTAAIVPGVALWILAAGRSPLACLPAAIALAIVSVFVRLAYPRTDRAAAGRVADGAGL